MLKLAFYFKFNKWAKLNIESILNHKCINTSKHSKMLSFENINVIEAYIYFWCKILAILALRIQFQSLVVLNSPSWLTLRIVSALSPYLPLSLVEIPACFTGFLPPALYLILIMMMMIIMIGVVVIIIKQEVKRRWQEAGGLHKLSDIKELGKFVVKTLSMGVRSQGPGRK